LNERERILGCRAGENPVGSRFYLNTEDYRAFALRTFAERKQPMEDLGLAQK
jgi:hypothetical protein